MIKIITAVYNAYLEAIAFTDTGHSDGECESGIEFSDECKLESMRDCADFLARCESAGLLAQYTQENQTWDSFGIDFWLTRNHHGAGFWDRGMGDLGEKLTSIAHTMGERSLYEGDDGKGYLS